MRTSELRRIAEEAFDLAAKIREGDSLDEGAGDREAAREWRTVELVVGLGERICRAAEITDLEIPDAISEMVDESLSNTGASDEQARRRERFAALLAAHGQTPDDYDEEVEEDPRPYLYGDEPISRFVCVTANSGKTYFYSFDSRGAAESRACEYADDSLFAETPVAVVDLDTGATWTPQWQDLPFRPAAPLAAEEARMGN